MTIGAADDVVIRAVWRLHYLTAEQLCRLLYSERSITYARERLAALARDEYLFRRAMPRPSRTGSAPWVYVLGPKGKAYLESLGEDVDRLRLADVIKMHLPHLDHSLAITDCLITVERFCATTPDVRLHELRHERDLQPVRVAIGQGKHHVTVIPDAWFDLRRRTPAGVFRRCIAVEVDRGTEHQRVWRRKVAALLSWADGPYRTLFGTDTLTIAVVNRAGPRRLQELRRWTEEELSERGRQGSGAWFRFATNTPDTVGVRGDAAAWFDAPIWSVPFADQPVALLG